MASLRQNVDFLTVLTGFSTGSSRACPHPANTGLHHPPGFPFPPTQATSQPFSQRWSRAPTGPATFRRHRRFQERAQPVSWPSPLTRHPRRQRAAFPAQAAPLCGTHRWESRHHSPGGRKTDATQRRRRSGGKQGWEKRGTGNAGPDEPWQSSACSHGQRRTCRRPGATGNPQDLGVWTSGRRTTAPPSGRTLPKTSTTSAPRTRKRLRTI